MSRNRFEKGGVYLLTDRKGEAFEEEPAVYAGKHDSDMFHPSICAVCGDRLGGEGYHSFRLQGPDGLPMDMMIGEGCIRDRVEAVEADEQGGISEEDWQRVVAAFPNGGRWYGTFLHNCIAKPYIRDRKVAVGWGESVLGMPGVRFIMKTVDGLLDEGWALEAEKVVDSGRIDLLATHPERGTAVFDWKSDRAFGSCEAYVEQVKGYMAELNRMGMPSISGYILWITKEKKEYVPYDGHQTVIRNGRGGRNEATEKTRCTLRIDMNGGEGARKKNLTIETSDFRPEFASFYVPPCKPSKHNHEFDCFEAPPCREGDRPQYFSREDAEKGFHVSFVCSKKRRSFVLTAKWKIIRPFVCSLKVTQKTDWGDMSFFVSSLSKIDENGEDYVEFDVSEINGRLYRGILAHAMLADCEMPAGTKCEWLSEDL